VNSPTQALDINSLDSINAAKLQPVNLDLPDTAAPEPMPEPVPEPKPRKRERSPFELRANPMIERNIPVIPLLPRTKIAFLDHWQERASVDPMQVVEWGELDPDSNAACVAYAKPGGKWFFEVDEPSILKRIENETGKKIPETFTVCSSGEKRHHYFNQTAASIEMGNQGGKDKDGKESWSARCDNRYVVAPNSIHPDPEIKESYTIIKDVPIVEAPQWLVEWVKDNAFNSSKNTAGARVNASPDGPAIPRGSHDNELFRIACSLRNAGLGYEQIKDHLIGVCEKRCVDYGADYVDMCDRKAKQACNYSVGQAGKAGPIPVMGGGVGEAKADVSNWRSEFRNLSQMEQGPITMVIDGVLQEGTCFLGATAGHGKTLVALAIAKAITLGEPLFGIPGYTVNKPRNVIYLIPESGDKAFRTRGEAFRLPQDDRFIARTISSGGRLALSDPLILEAVRQQHPVVIIDTASRFIHGSDENSAAENRLLVDDVIALRAGGAVAVIILHHAKKSTTEKREAMTLENMLRGTSDFGAMCDQAYGLRLDVNLYNHGAGPMELELVNLKDRERLGGLTSVRLAATYKKPGAIFPTSFIDETGNFHPVDFRETKDRTREALIQLVESEPMMSVDELREATGLKVHTIRETLKRLGWHAVKGGSDGHSPWHKDDGKPCPYKVKRKGGVDLDEPVFKAVRVN
jgi:hypothetical protein